MTNGNAPINPVMNADGTNMNPGNDTQQWIEQVQPFIGLSKREYFSAMAMQGMCANSEIQRATSVTIQGLVIEAVAYADELINELNKQP